MNAIHLFFHWPDGGVWSNLLASAIWVAPALALAWWKGMCRIPLCPRRGRHQVDGTTWKVCDVHHKPEHHARLFHLHRAKHPDRMGWGDSHSIEKGGAAEDAH